MRFDERTIKEPEEGHFGGAGVRVIHIFTERRRGVEREGEGEEEGKELYP